MSEEEIDVLYNEILKLPKVERPMKATTQCEINVNDLFDTIRAFRKIPDYSELIKDNRKKDKEIEKLNNIINELEKWLEQEYAVAKANSIQEPNNLEWYIKWNERKNTFDKLQELKGVDKK